MMLENLPRFPCKLSNKKPLTEHGFYDADFGDYTHYPLVGVPTGAIAGFDVLDIDPRHKGHIWLQQHELPKTRAHWTRGGGRHFLFRYAGVRLRKELAPGVELKGDGGYIIWWPREGLQVDDHPIAPWPEWLLELARKEEPDEKGTRGNDTKPGLGSVSPIQYADERARAIAKVVLNDPTEKALYWATCKFSEMVKWGFPIEQAHKFLDAVSPYVKISAEAAQSSIARGLTNADKRIKGLVRTVESAPVGRRNKTLYWVSMELCRLTPDYHELLVDAALECGLTLSEIEPTINSATGRETRTHAPNSA
jgi:hypothetical protein